MRQAGVIASETEAHLFVDYLLTRGIDGQVDQELAGWVVWIRDENHLAEAKQLLAEFVDDPDDPRYQEVASKASTIRQEASRKVDQARQNVVDIRGRWDRGMARRAPIVIAVIGICVLVFLITGGFDGKRNRAMRLLEFCDAIHTVGGDWTDSTADRLTDIRSGQVWRLISPIFLHGDLLHLAFNMYMFYYFGAQIERQRGSLRLLLMIAVIGAISVVCQSLFESPWGGGMSGVVYGLFGYIWMKSTYDPGSGLYVSQMTVVILCLWFVLCLVGFKQNVANTAHAVGLAAGLVWGYWPVSGNPSNNRMMTLRSAPPCSAAEPLPG